MDSALLQRKPAGEILPKTVLKQGSMFTVQGAWGNIGPLPVAGQELKGKCG